MELLIQLYGEDLAYKNYANLKAEIPNMDESYYIKNSIRTYHTF